jgi:hypothetical protein
MRILMPRDAFAVALGFADEMAGKQGDYKGYYSNINYNKY